MDRKIDPQIRRRRRAKRVGFGLLAGGAAIGLLAGASSLLRTSVSREAITTARVMRGRIEATIQATGLVLPEIERVLSSPLDARFVRVLQPTGGPSRRRAIPILELDLSESKLALERLKQDLALKENQQARTRLDLESTLSTLRARSRSRRWSSQNLAGHHRAATRSCSPTGSSRREELRQLGAERVARAGIELRSSRSPSRSPSARPRRSSRDSRSNAAAPQGRAEAARQLDLATTQARTATAS